MNTAQKIIGAVGALLVLVAGVHPMWDVSATVRYDFEIKLDDNDRSDFESSVMQTMTQERACVFAGKNAPKHIYSPPEERIFDPKKGYMTKVCTSQTLVQYKWTLNAQQMLVEMLAFLLPTILLLVVFKNRKED